MQRLHNYGITIQEYHARGKSNSFPEVYGCPQPRCPYRRKLRRHGFYERNALGFGVYRLWIPRYLCPVCGHTVSVLPSFLAPHFQYTLSVVWFSLRLLAGARLGVAEVASRVRRFMGTPEFSRVHVQLYRRRAKANRKLCALCLVGNGVAMKLENGSLGHWQRGVAAMGGIQRFHERFSDTFHACFLARI